MADTGDPEPDAVPVPTRWDIRRELGGRASYTSAKGRRFAIGDRLNMPPPLPRGSTWTVIAIDPPETEGYDGTLVVEPAESSPLAGPQ
jgi:hypothetical protein